MVFFCVGVCARAGAVFDRTQASEIVSVQQRQQERGREQDRQCTCASVKDTASEREKSESVYKFVSGRGCVILCAYVYARRT